MATTKSTKKVPVKPKAKVTVAKKLAPAKKTTAKKPAAHARTASKKTRMIVTLGSEEKRLFTLVSIWLALIAIFLGMVVYQTYIK
jgi:hypothetical protein